MRGVGVWFTAGGIIYVGAATMPRDCAMLEHAGGNRFGRYARASWNVRQPYVLAVDVDVVGMTRFRCLCCAVCIPPCVDQTEVVRSRCNIKTRFNVNPACLASQPGPMVSRQQTVPVGNRSTFHSHMICLHYRAVLTEVSINFRIRP